MKYLILLLTLLLSNAIAEKAQVSQHDIDNKTVTVSGGLVDLPRAERTEMFVIADLLKAHKIDEAARRNDELIKNLP